MIFIVFGILLAIALLITVLGSIFKKRKIFLLGIYIILVLIVCSIIYGIYAIESKIEEENNINISEKGIIKTPDRIIYKNENNEYYILDSYNANFPKLFSEVYKRIDKNIEGKVL